MGANCLLLNMNVGAMAHDVFLEQIRRFGKEVLPRLQAHQVKRVPRGGVGGAGVGIYGPAPSAMLPQAGGRDQACRATGLNPPARSAAQ